MIRDKWQVNKDYKSISVEILQENLSALRAKAGINQEELANILQLVKALQQIQTFGCEKKKNRD